MRKLISTSSGIELSDYSLPNISDDDVLIETIGSCYSKGTETSTVKNHQKSLIKKIIDNRTKIYGLIKNKEIDKLFAKLKSQQTSTINLGYSSSGKVLAVGKNVLNVHVGDIVVAVGSSANHSQYSIVPKGLCVNIGNQVNPLDASASAVGCIALNSVHLANPLLGSSSLVIGCGLLGQFVTQFLSISGVKVTCIDIDEWKFNQAKLHGASSCMTMDEFQASNIQNSYDDVYIVTPAINTGAWSSIGNAAKINAKILMLGAADLNCPRDIFYKKHLNFIAPHSYGPGRSIYEYEIMNHDFPNLSKTWDIRSNIRIFIELLISKKISTDFLTKYIVHSSDSDSLLNALEDPKSYSAILDWRNCEKESIDKSYSSKKEIEAEKIKFNNIALYGYSSFAKEAHIPSIKLFNDLTFKGIFNRSPIKKDHEKDLSLKDLQSNEVGTVVVSSNHGTHAKALIDLMKLGKFIIIDKPLCISSKELDEIRKVYKSSNSNFLCFMSRRYSKHTLILEKYIQNRSGPFHMDFLFQVPIKDTDDHIYREGGRLVGEMCHHVDLAIYLFGKPVSIHYVDNEKCKEARFRENLSILMSFKCGSSAHIRYSSIGNSEGIKERIKLNFDNDSIEVIDFKKTFIIANEKSKILHNEFDKGFYGSWSFINELILQDRISSNETKKLSELDILVTKVLLREHI